MSEVRHIQINAPWLVNEELQVCVVQTAPPTMEQITGDLSRADNVALMGHLLGGKPGVCGGNPMLTELLPGNLPVLVVVPEYAFGSEDWSELDAAVRGCRRPLILLAGFGATRGDVLRCWAETGADEGTTRRFEENLTGVSSTSRYNGAWCWGHIPDSSTRCHCILKGFPEQTDEWSRIPDLALGSVQIVLELDDVIIAPGICADLINENPDGWMPCLQSWRSLHRTKPLLAVGMLCQKDPHKAQWQRALRRLVDLPGTCNALMVNHATRFAAPEEDNDRWRSLSGVYANRSQFGEKDQGHLPAVRKVYDTTFLGVLIRDPEPCAVGGTIRWTSGATIGRFLWHAGRLVAMGDDGTAFDEPSCPDGLACECARYVTRRFALNETGGGGVLRATLQDLRTFLAGDSARRRARRLGESLTTWTAYPYRADLGADRALCTLLRKPEWLAKISDGLTAALFFRYEGVGQWNDEEERGQLHWDGDAGHLHVLVWVSADHSQFLMQRKIGEWLREPHPASPLLLVSGPRSGRLAVGAIAPGRRGDVTQADELRGATRGSHVELFSIVRSAYSLPLSDVQSLYPWDGGPRGLLEKVREALGGSGS